MVLRQPGLGFGKCSILCGGPDWPTSVLCGILKLNVWQMVVGLTPMFFYVAPSVVAGAFQYYGPSWGGTWDSLAAFLLLAQAVAFTPPAFLSRSTPATRAAVSVRRRARFCPRRPKLSSGAG